MSPAKGPDVLGVWGPPRVLSGPFPDLWFMPVSPGFFLSHCLWPTTSASGGDWQVVTRCLIMLVGVTNRTLSPWRSWEA